MLSRLSGGYEYTSLWPGFPRSAHRQNMTMFLQEERHPSIMSINRCVLKRQTRAAWCVGEGTGQQLVSIAKKIGSRPLMASRGLVYTGEVLTGLKPLWGLNALGRTSCKATKYSQGPKKCALVQSRGSEEKSFDPYLCLHCVCMPGVSQRPQPSLPSIVCFSPQRLRLALLCCRARVVHTQTHTGLFGLLGQALLRST